MLRIPFLSAEAPYVLIAVALLLFFILKPLRALRPSLINTSVFFAACLAGDLLAGIVRCRPARQRRIQNLLLLVIVQAKFQR